MPKSRTPAFKTMLAAGVADALATTSAVRLTRRACRRHGGGDVAQYLMKDGKYLKGHGLRVAPLLLPLTAADCLCSLFTLDARSIRTS